MNGLLFIIVVCLTYYAIYKYYPQYIEEKYHYYLGGFVGIYLLILYLFTFENEFMYKIFKNVYDTHKQPLYSFNAQDSNSQLYHSMNPNQNIRQMLAIHQNGRCDKCGNIIMKNDLDYYKLKYKVPLQQGGQNDASNLSLVCPNCMF
jgi:hypothetical protein|tara:strand:- start:18 stop:458 length:441 start_codon:yes stop_codon:yes gene_type:complete